jgi:hypothetical protein
MYMYLHVLVPFAWLKVQGLTVLLLLYPLYHHHIGHIHVYCTNVHVPCKIILIPYLHEKVPMGGVAYIGPRSILGDRPIFEVPLSHLNMKEPGGGGDIP